FLKLHGNFRVARETELRREDRGRKPGEENLRSLIVAVLRALEDGHGLALLVNNVANGGA
ncbi:MAG TPA: hypothetical protein VHY79_06330, partial [Rhizomicrobium sp.]|nr:hypothetical protein [Rhizomicrobium sp.]